MCRTLADCADCPNADLCAEVRNGTYEAECEAYALYGDPEADHWHYEENASYDQFDGQRGDFAEDALWEGRYDDEPCPDCGYRGDCPVCVDAATGKAELDKLVRAEFEAAQLYAASAGDDDTPF